MNILLIGNGFDLAHGLPTKYTHFLDFCKCVFILYRTNEEGNTQLSQQLLKCDFNEEIKEKLRNAFESRRIINNEKNILQIQTDYPKLDELYTFIQDNMWMECFHQCDTYQNENWVDFESEIGTIIQSIDMDMRGKNFDSQIDHLSNTYLEDKFLYKGCESLFVNEKGERGGKQNISFIELRDILYKDLNRLVRALEIYLCEFVEKMRIEKKLPDINDLKIDHVLSFNYTNTYSRLYGKTIEMKDSDLIDYIHGKANIDNTIESNNMVLGIDEYLGKKRRNKDVEFIAFKKFYQRIHKQTGCMYRDWVDEIIQKNNEHENKIRQKQLEYKRNGGMGYEGDQTRRTLENLRNNPPKHNLYIFGHSLDLTDGDILRDLMLNNNVYTTIFYLSKDVEGQQIANLVKVIGQDELIKRTGGKTATIEFVQQKPLDDKIK